MKEREREREREREKEKPIIFAISQLRYLYRFLKIILRFCFTYIFNLKLNTLSKYVTHIRRK